MGSNVSFLSIFCLLLVTIYVSLFRMPLNLVPSPSLFDTLITLIPKVDCPKSLKEFLPISLCNTIYKVITKVLVNWIRPLLDSIISPL